MYIGCRARAVDIDSYRRLDVSDLKGCGWRVESWCGLVVGLGYIWGCACPEAHTIRVTRWEAAGGGDGPWRRPVYRPAASSLGALVSALLQICAAARSELMLPRLRSVSSTDTLQAVTEEEKSAQQQSTSDK